MTTYTVCSERVARSWLLEKLLGPKQEEAKKEPSRSRTLTESEQEDLLEATYKSLKKTLIDAVQGGFPALDQAEKRIANQHGIDPLFLNWYVVNGSNWPSMPNRTKNALKTMQSARLWFAEVPSSWSRMRVPSLDEAKARDAAIKELGDWFLKSFVAKVEHQFTNEIWAQSRNLLDALKGQGPKPMASVLLLREFKKRLGQDRFQLKPAIRRLVELFD